MAELLLNNDEFIQLVKDAKINTERTKTYYEKMLSDLMGITNIVVDNNKRKSMKCNLFNLYKEGNITEKNKNKLKNILINVFGEDFYKDENLLKLIEPSYKSYDGIYYGEPKSLDDLIDIFTMYAKYLKEPQYLKSEKNKLISIVNTINEAIARRIVKFEKAINQMEFVLTNLNQIRSGMKSSKKLVVEDENFYDLVNRNITATIMEESVNIEMGVGDIIRQHLEKHNENVELKRQNKEYEEKLNRYFRRLNRSKDPDWEDFPDMEDPDYIKLRDDLFVRFLDADRSDLYAQMSLSEAHQIRKKINK